MFPLDDPENEKKMMVRRSNDLVEARYKLTLEEQRLVLLLSSLIHPNDEDFKSYEIRVQDFAQMFGLEKRKAIYEKVEEASRRLTGRTIELSKEGKKIYAAWLSYVEYVEGSGIIKVEFHSSLKPYLLQLHRNFTQYRLGHVIKFKSSYSIRLYELLKKDGYKAKNNQFERFFSVEEYRECLGVNKGNYKAFDNFRRRVIEPTVREISDLTELNIFEVRYTKTGRKITGICFVVLIRGEEEAKARAENLRLEDIALDRPEELHPVIQALTDYGLSFDNVQSLKNKYGVKRIERNIAYMLGEEKNGIVIKNKPKYIAKALAEDWGNVLEAQEQKRKENEARKKAEEIAKQKAEAEQQKKEQETKERNKKLLEDFAKFPSGIQKMTKHSFAESIKNNTFVYEKWKQYQDEEKDFISDPMLRSLFIKHLIENKMIE